MESNQSERLIQVVEKIAEELEHINRELQNIEIIIKHNPTVISSR